MNILDIRKSLDGAINKLMALAGNSVSEPVKLKLRRAYTHLCGELEQIDRDILGALDEELIDYLRTSEAKETA